MTRKFGWTKNVLVHQIENQTYEKTLLTQTTFDRTVSAKTSMRGVRAAAEAINRRRAREAA